MTSLRTKIKDKYLADYLKLMKEWDYNKGQFPTCKWCQEYLRNG